METKKKKKSQFNQFVNHVMLFISSFFTQQFEIRLVSKN